MAVQDQNGTVHEYDYDLLGRQIEDRVTAVGPGVDNTILRIASTYEVRGMRTQLTSYDNASVGSGSVVNEVQFTYNDFGQVVADYQAHAGSVNTGSTPKVQYGYANGSNNTIRPTSLTYPNGRVVGYEYGLANSTSDALSRIDGLTDSATSGLPLNAYQYLGVGAFVEQDYLQGVNTR